MLSLSIYLDSDQPTFATTDAATVAAVRDGLTASLPEGYSGPTDSHLVPAHDLAAILRSAGRKHWASVLEGEEEASMVRVEIRD